MATDPPEENSLVGVCQSTDEELASPAPLHETISTEQVDGITRLAVKRAGGLDDVIQPGDWVVIKPNIVVAPGTNTGWKNKGTCTDLRVLKSVIEQLIEEGDANRITIAEGKSWRKVGEEGTPADQIVDGWNVVWDHYGQLSYEQMIEDLNNSTSIIVDFIDLDYANTSPYVKDVPVPGGGLSQATYTIPEAILNCDRLIAVATMKTHSLVKVTALQKIYIGISPAEVYTGPINGTLLNAFDHFAVPHGLDVAFTGDPQLPITFVDDGTNTTDRTVVDLVSYHPPDFGIVECFWGLEGNGPIEGNSVKRNLVIAGKDPVAVDSVTAYSMGFNPWDLDYSHWSRKKGFGTNDLNYIDVNGLALEDMVYEFKKATSRGRGCRAWLLNGFHQGVSLDTDYLEGAEDTIAPIEGEVTSGKTWTAFSDYTDFMDLGKYYEGPSFCNTYAFTRIIADSDMDVRLRFGSDDGIKIWLNGTVIFTDKKPGTFSWIEEDLPIRLVKGENRLLVKIQNMMLNYGFSMYVSEPDGDTPLGIKYSITP